MIKSLIQCTPTLIKMKYPIEHRLNTQIIRITPNGSKPLNYFLDETGFVNKNRSTDWATVTIFIKGKKMGHMEYALSNSSMVFIHRIINYSNKSFIRFQGVGTALLEYLFRKYPEHHIMLRSTNPEDKTPSKFYSLGFRSVSIIGDWEEFKDLLKVIPNKSEYSEEQASEAIIKIQEKIGVKKFARRLEEIADTLGEFKFRLTNKEILEYFLFSKKNFEYEDLSKKGSECDSLIEGVMYISPISFKKLEKRYSRFIPLASNLSFSKKEALRRLSNSELIQLVKENTLDPSNAMDIEAKLVSRENDPKRWEFILSDIGLEMMRLNCFSAFLFCTYLNEESLFYLISESGLSILKQALLTWDEIINLPLSFFPYVFSPQGEEDLKADNLKFSVGKFGLFSLEKCQKDKLPVNSFWQKIPLEEKGNFLNEKKSLTF